MFTRDNKIFLLMFGAVLLFIQTNANANYPTFNRHLYVDGGGYISVPYSPSLNAVLSSGGTFTIDAWIYPTSFANIPTIVGNEWTAGYWLGLNTSGKIRFYPGGGTFRESINAVPLNQWTHIAVSFNTGKAELRIYINNVLDVLHGNVGVTIGTNQMDLRIGADRSGSTANYFFQGYIDEVRIWNTEIDFPSTSGSLYKIPHEFGDGRYGNFLVSAWRLNGDGADSVSNNNGSAVGAVAWQTTNNPPHYSRICAVLLNNNSQGTHDFFTVPHSSSISLTTNYTLECWVNLFTLQGGSTSYQTFICKGSTASNALMYWLGVNKQNGKLRFVPTGDFNNALESSDPLPTNTWVHVAGRYSYAGNNGTATVFINGVPKGSANFQGTALPNNFPLLIGTSDQQLFPPTSLGLVGKIDEVRLWNIVRSNDEIGNNYRFELDSGQPNLVASYHFDGDALDLSGNNNHGYNFNAASNDMYFLNASDLPAFPTLTLLIPNGGESWQIGTTQNITWSVSGLSSLKLELSRDGGASFTETIVDPVSASAGSFNWFVTGPATANARVRIATSTPTSASDESDANFKITEPPPLMSIVPQSFSFTAVKGDPPPPSQTAHITNTGGSSMTWSAASSQSWVGAVPNAGASNTDSTEITINTTNLVPGTYNAMITFNGNAVNAPINIPVVYTVKPPPHIDLIPSTLQFTTTPGINPPPKFVKIKNTSFGLLNWTASSSTLWLSFAPSSGVQEDSIRIEADVSGLSTGTYNGSVNISGNADNSPVQIQVQLVISTTPMYAVSGKVISGTVGISGVTINVTGDATTAVNTLSDGSFALSFPAGSYLLTPSSAYYNFTPTSVTITGLSAPRTGILFTAAPKNGSAKFHYQKGWNLISLNIDPTTHDINTLFPDAETPRVAYRYSRDTGYIAETNLNFGSGYWIKFTRDDSVTITGMLRGDFNVSCGVSSGGWNLIGGATGTVPLSSIVQNPPGSIITIYQYNTGVGYVLPPGDLLRAERGYFVKVSRDVILGMYSSFTGSMLDLRRAQEIPSTLPDVLNLPPIPKK